MNNAMISVIIPIYNSSEYLDRCIQSILNQSFQNIEIILINDGSTDNSLDICNMYQGKYSNITVYSQKNSGQGAARNLGVVKAKGNYVSFIDSDDYIDKNMYECMLELANYNNSDIVVCGHEKIYSEDQLALNCDEYSSDYRKLSNGEEKIKDYLSNNISSLSCDKLYRRDLLIDNNIKYPENCFFEDVSMVLECLHYSNIVVINDIPFYKYVQRLDSTTYTRTEKHLNDFKTQIKNCYKFIYENYDYNKIKIEVKSFKFLHTNMLLKMIKDLKKEYEVSEYFKILPKKFVIFGASSAGELMQYFCDLYNINVEYFCDNSEQKWGERLNEILIISPRQLRQMKENDYSIYIASMYYKPIYDQLTEFGLENKIIDLEIF